ncbi:unnamed protein product [Pleuronectes platessa]|uniref:Uncharacterized protein n=1 Tax=Pleuronectes platessa TaxID=8262 RepID=A0A9N7Y5N6_PLEPL|nr:unnamed protein product [Pleuronectes platessa]
MCCFIRSDRDSRSRSALYGLAGIPAPIVTCSHGNGCVILAGADDLKKEPQEQLASAKRSRSGQVISGAHIKELELLKSSALTFMTSVYARMSFESRGSRCEGHQAEEAGGPSGPGEGSLQMGRSSSLQGPGPPETTRLPRYQVIAPTHFTGGEAHRLPHLTGTSQWERGSEGVREGGKEGRRE